MQNCYRKKNCSNRFIHRGQTRCSSSAQYQFLFLIFLNSAEVRHSIFFYLVFLDRLSTESIGFEAFIFNLRKGPGKRGHIVANTLLPTKMFPRLPACATFVAGTNFVSGTQKMFLILFRKFCVRNKCFPVCAAQVTSWATMCPQQCVLVCQYL